MRNAWREVHHARRPQRQRASLGLEAPGQLNRRIGVGQTTIIQTPNSGVCKPAKSPTSNSGNGIEPTIANELGDDLLQDSGEDPVDWPLECGSRGCNIYPDRWGIRE